SGFVQTVFKLIGVPLPRDAYQQAEQGVPINNFNEARQGDVAFFKNENGRVTHVGILSGEGKIIHSSGKVRIDDLDSEGIVNSENGIRTHYFHSVRRCF
ncbi:MAG: NlpC/P60 family protein, partial [Bacteroidota bacterium]